MDLRDAIDLAKDHAEKHTLAFTGFFYRQTPKPEFATYEHVATGALIYLVIGVTLQSSFIGGMKVEDISWLDRAVTQLVFWVTVGFIVHVASRTFQPLPNRNGFLVTFRVMPVAFLCGAYASSIGFFVNYLLKFTKHDFSTVPHFFHMVVQLSVIARYMPREIREHCSQSVLASRVVTAFVVLFVLAVDLIVVSGPIFLDVDTNASATGGGNATK
jgi:hypothetical protein